MFNITQRYQFQFTNVHNLFKKVIRTEDRGLLTYLLENVDFMFSLLHVYLYNLYNCNQNITGKCICNQLDGDDDDDDDDVMYYVVSIFA